MLSDNIYILLNYLLKDFEKKKKRFWILGDFYLLKKILVLSIYAVLPNDAEKSRS